VIADNLLEDEIDSQNLTDLPSKSKACSRISTRKQHDDSSSCVIGTVSNSLSLHIAGRRVRPIKSVTEGQRSNVHISVVGQVSRPNPDAPEGCNHKWANVP
jgi:hypothetical protein